MSLLDRGTLQRSTGVCEKREVVVFEELDLMKIQDPTGNANLGGDEMIHVVLASDNNYFEGLLTAAVSISVNCSRRNLLKIHVLDGGITDENWSSLEAMVRNCGSQISRIVVRQEDHFSGLGTYHGSGRMTYARLLIPDLLPDISQVIYSDVDVLWLSDVAKLWDGIDQDTCLGYVQPLGASFSRLSEASLDWYKENGCVNHEANHFCAGVIVMNIKKFRDEELHHQMLELLSRYCGNVPSCDEGAINAFMCGRPDVQCLPSNWQIGTGDVYLVDNADVGLVLHYACDTPWRSLHSVHHMLTDSLLLWHRIHALIRGTTVWSSIRCGDSTFGVIVGRMLYIAASRFPPFRWMVELAMLCKGRALGIPCFRAFARKPTFDCNALFSRFQEKFDSILHAAGVARHCRVA